MVFYTVLETQNFFSMDTVSSLRRGTLAIVGLPAHYNFGFDMRIWEIGDRFTGARGIPNGIHFVSYSPPDDEVRQGFFIDVNETSGLMVRVWDPETESLELLDSGTEKFNMIARTYMNDFRYISGLAPFDSCLSEENVSDWRAASRFITPRLIERIQPINAKTFLSGSQPTKEGLNQELRTIFFTDLGKLKPPLELTASEVTSYHRDKSHHLTQALSKFENERDIVGELQVSFILFLLGLNYDAFVQWRKLVELLLGCQEEGVRHHPEVFVAASSALGFQVKQMPDEFLFDAGISDDDVPHRRNERNVFILPLISQFVITCSNESLLDLVELQHGVQQLDKAMAEKYGDEWTSIFNPEDHDDPPVIVDLS